MNPPDTSTVGPGMGAFIAFLFLAIALWLLMRNMNSRLRRMKYADQAEERAAQAAGSDRTDQAEERAAQAAGTDHADQAEERAAQAAGTDRTDGEVSTGADASDVPPAGAVGEGPVGEGPGTDPGQESTR